MTIELKDLNSEDRRVENVPNEHTGFYFSSHIKIIDTDTKEILVETRGDN